MELSGTLMPHYLAPLDTRLCEHDALRYRGTVQIARVRV